MFRWIAGFLTGAAWSVINFLLIVAILKIAVLKKDPQKLMLLLLVKFPVLYLTGFLVLFSKVFPPMSLLAGAAVILITVGVMRVCQKPA